MKMRFLIRVFLVTLAFSRIVLAGPVSLPPMNLGGNNFTDAIAYPGWLLEENVEYYQANHFTGSSGDRVPGQNKLATASAVSHLAYISEYRWLGAYLGVEALLPIVDVDFDTSFLPPIHKGGLGDIAISPLVMQWNRKLFGKPFFQRFVFLVNLPTGQYDSSSPVNPGSHLYSINPYYACTVFPTPKLELSARLNYLWNSENGSPYEELHANSVQPGQALYLNLATSYEAFKNIRIGINGYVLQQLTDDRLDGQKVPDSKESVFGIGPGLVIQKDTFRAFLSCYFETGAQNRPEGVKAAVRISKVF